MNYQQFRIVYDNKIMANEKSIAELKTNIAGAKEENKVLYQKKLAELERRNNDLKIELNNSKSEGADEWLKFKTEFKNDMDDLGKSFADFTVTTR
jgi:predicted RNase H-like nuclease (RuvC/YqgF family)